MLLIHKIPVLTDNYIFIIENTLSKEAAVVDPAISRPIIDFARSKKLSITSILNTHHHWDHIGANDELKRIFNCKIYGYSNDKHRIPGITHEVISGETISVCGHDFFVEDIPGHTLGHIYFFNPTNKILFSGDTLFSLGCGRLFEGTPQQMYESLKKITTLPKETKIYFSHEYTLSNLEFSQSIVSNLSALNTYGEYIRENIGSHFSSCPSTIEKELNCNLFLNCHQDWLKQALNSPDETDLETFTRLRVLKDHF
ncbi:MAG: hydroxyacylglutathione hydrolase [Bdellovibrionales bacterium]|nr:hydroxyacylglutathione hydrolase [Bdellovibrionales bacterium]